MGRDKIYVADTGNSRIQIFSKDGIFLNSVGNPGGDKPNIFSKPTRVVVDANKDMYVLDKEQKRVLVFSHDHRLLYKIGGTDDKPLFDDIYDIAIDADNNLYILASVPGNKTSIQIYSGPKKVISFGASNDQMVGMDEPVSLSVAPEHKTVAPGL
jgi:DNA-binding beta-propeller fold protein YncE